MNDEPTEENGVKRWTAKRKAAVVVDLMKGRVTMAEVCRQYDLTPSDVETWGSDAERGMENGLRRRPRDIRDEYEAQAVFVNIVVA